MKLMTWLLRIYWLLVIIIFLGGGWLIDLHTFTDSIDVLCAAAIFTLPLIIYSLKLVLPDLQWRWYGNIFMSLVIGGLYIASAYYAIKKLDLLLSSMVKPTANQHLNILSVNKVLAGRAGFIHTNVVLEYRDKPLQVEGSRSSYFLLQNKRIITIAVGRTLLGEYFGNYVNMPFSSRWQAFKSYWQDWVQRYWWLAIVFVLMLLWDPFKRIFFNK